MTNLEWARARVAERRADHERLQKAYEEGDLFARAGLYWDAVGRLAEAEDWLRRLESTAKVPEPTPTFARECDTCGKTMQLFMDAPDTYTTCSRCGDY